MDEEKEKAAAETLRLFEESLKESEMLGEQVIMEKQLIVDLDRKRQANREALSALKKLQPQIEDVEANTALWFCTGSMFVQLPRKGATEIIREDQKILDQSIEEHRNTLKVKIDRIQQIEKEADPTIRRNEVSARSFNIKALKDEDW